jgi:uroporphyrinogen-III synthase
MGNTGKNDLRRILITQAKEDSREFGELLKQRGFSVIYLPQIEFCPLKIDFNLSDFDVFVFMSKHAFKFLKGKIEQEGLRSKKIICVGQRTAEVVRACGIDVDHVPSDHSSDGVAKLLRDTVSKEVSIGVFHSNIGKKKFIEALKGDGYNIISLPVFETRRVEYNKDEVQRIKALSFDMVTFMSPSSAINFVANFGKDRLSGVHICAIGETTASAVKDMGFTVHVIAWQKDVKSMADTIRSFYDKN